MGKGKDVMNAIVCPRLTVCTTAPAQGYADIGMLVGYDWQRVCELLRGCQAQGDRFVFLLL